MYYIFSAVNDKSIRLAIKLKPETVHNITSSIFRVNITATLNYEQPILIRLTAEHINSPITDADDENNFHGSRPKHQPEKKYLSLEEMYTSPDVTNLLQLDLISTLSSESTILLRLAMSSSFEHNDTTNLLPRLHHGPVTRRTGCLKICC